MLKKTIEELHRVDVRHYREAVAKLPVTVVLDDVRSEMNVGSVFRTADAFVMERIILCGITGTPPSVEIHKTALGAEDAVLWEHCPTALQAVERLKREGYRVCAVEQVHDSIALQDFRPEPGSKYAIVLGNEVKGVSQSAVDASHCCLEIPQWGTKHSLNVANSAAIVMWHFFAALHQQ